MAISGTLSFASASAAVDSRRPGVLTFRRRRATFSSTALAMDPNRHCRGSRPAGDSFSVRGLCRANEDAQFSPDCSTDRQGDEPERSYLCLGKPAATLQFFRPADGYSFRELLTLGWRLRQPASRGDKQREESASGDVGDVSGRLENAPSGAHYRHVDGGPVLVGSSHDSISCASRLPSRISCGGRDQWPYNLPSALTLEAKHAHDDTEAKHLGCLSNVQ